MIGSLWDGGTLYLHRTGTLLTDPLFSFWVFIISPYAKAVTGGPSREHPDKPQTNHNQLLRCVLEFFIFLFFVCLFIYFFGSALFHDDAPSP